MLAALLAALALPFAIYLAARLVSAWGDGRGEREDDGITEE